MSFLFGLVIFITIAELIIGSPPACLFSQVVFYFFLQENDMAYFLWFVYEISTSTAWACIIHAYFVSLLQVCATA